MITRDEVREVLHTLPDDYLRRYVDAYETRELSCFPGNGCLACAITVMIGAEWYHEAKVVFLDAVPKGERIEYFYEGIGSYTTLYGPNATPLYDECVLELARRADVPSVVAGV